jgi:hypothetical protein
MKMSYCMCAHGVSWDPHCGGGGGLWYSAAVITEPRVNITQSAPPLFDRNHADVVDSAELRARCYVESPPGNIGSNPGPPQCKWYYREDRAKDNGKMLVNLSWFYLKLQNNIKWRNLQENIRIQEIQRNWEIVSTTLEGSLKFVKIWGGGGALWNIKSPTAISS